MFVKLHSLRRFPALGSTLHTTHTSGENCIYLCGHNICTLFLQEYYNILLKASPDEFTMNTGTKVLKLIFPPPTFRLEQFSTERKTFTTVSRLHAMT